MKPFDLIVKMLSKLEINRAVIFSLISKLWNLTTGPIIIVVITQWFNLEEQGFYYTFTSILLLQMFFELGLGIALIQTASHEWAYLNSHGKYGIVGDQTALSRLSSLVRFSVNWYTISGFIFAVTLGVGGYIFFSEKPYQGIEWETPWILLSATTALTFPLIPLISILEGCNQVSEVYGFRLTQGIINSLVIVLSIVLGAGLFTPTISAASRLLCTLFFLIFKYSKFFKRLFSYPVLQKINWRSEIWPFQWRIGVSSLSGYLMNLLFTPIMFHFHGPYIAGQMGMTLSLVGVASSLGYTWVQARAPQFGAMIAKRKYLDLDILFRRLAGISITVTGLGACALWIVVFFLKFYEYEIGDRLLSIWQVTILLVAEIFKVVTIIIVFYLRAHKKEPLMFISLFSAVLSAVSIWVLGGSFGPLGATSGYLFVLAFISLPLTYIVFKRFRHYAHLCSN